MLLEILCHTSGMLMVYLWHNAGTCIIRQAAMYIPTDLEDWDMIWQFLCCFQQGSLKGRRSYNYPF